MISEVFSLLSKDKRQGPFSPIYNKVSYSAHKKPRPIKNMTFCNFFTENICRYKSIYYFCQQIINHQRYYYDSEAEVLLFWLLLLYRTGRAR